MKYKALVKIIVIKYREAMLDNQYDTMGLYADLLEEIKQL